MIISESLVWLKRFDLNNKDPGLICRFAVSGLFSLAGSSSHMQEFDGHGWTDVWAGLGAKSFH